MVKSTSMEQRFSVPNPFLPPTRRKVFISYHEADTTAVEDFIKAFGPEGEGVFTHKAVGLFGQGDFVDSTDPKYVMQRIREKYLEDSTVTIVLLGHCTHSRRYVDWELKASLTQPALGLPNGVMGIVLPSLGAEAHLPDRFQENWAQGHNNCYATLWQYPTSGAVLRTWIEDAYAARASRGHLIVNSREMMKNSAKCLVHNRVCNTDSAPKPAQPSLGALASLLGQQPQPYSAKSLLAAYYGQPKPAPQPYSAKSLLGAYYEQPKPSPLGDLLKALEPKPPIDYDAIARRLYGDNKP